MTYYGIVSTVLLLLPLLLGVVIMKLSGAGEKEPVRVTTPEQAVAFQERTHKAYLNARDFGIKAVTGIVQVCAITAVLVIGLFDRDGMSYSDRFLAWTTGLSLVLLVLGILTGILTTAATYFGYYCEAHASGYDFGAARDEYQWKLWRDRSNRCFDFALLVGVAAGSALLEGIVLLVMFWFKTTRASIL